MLAEDGKKMSKRLKNYPDPMDVVRKHCADALRLYLINSPVVHGQELRFKEDGMCRAPARQCGARACYGRGFERPLRTFAMVVGQRF